jgi:pimeloyl-ACP methyl ester carboxylesterase
MPSVVSKDGTRIGYDREGQGPPLILVDGAMCYRDSGPARPLAKLLAPHFTVFTYDRRGRGESTDTPPYAVEREVEDIDALIQGALIHEAGGSAFVYGISSGAALAMEAGRRLPGIRKLALYEAPFIVDATHSPLPENFRAQLQEFVATNHRGDAVKLFMRRVGVPAFGIFMMQWMPVWKKLTAIAHTLVYDITIIQDYSRGTPLPAQSWAAVRLPVLVADGGKSPTWMRNAMQAWAKVIPNATYRTLPGQTHMLKPQAIAPVLIEFFNS